MNKKIISLNISFFCFIYGFFLSGKSEANITCSESAKLFYDLILHLNGLSHEVEMQLASADALINQLKSSLQDCKEENQDEDQEVVLFTQQLNTLANTVQMQIKPEVLGVMLTNSMQYNVFLDDESSLMIAQSGTDLYFKLQAGDHNLWFDVSGNLWGYDKCGGIFTVINNKRITISSGKCCELFG